MPNNKCIDLYKKPQSFTDGHRRRPELTEKYHVPEQGDSTLQK